jgi:hypothetical protein
MKNKNKNISQKRAGGVAQDEGPEFKPQNSKKKKKKVHNSFQHVFFCHMPLLAYSPLMCSLGSI